MAANTDAFVDRCAAGDGRDTIVVPAGHFVLSLTGPGEDAGLTGDLDVTSELVLIGAGAGATIIDGGSLEWPDADRVIHVHPGQLLMLWSVTLRGGVCRNGAGIFNDGTLVLRDSDLRDNVTRSDVTCGGASGAAAPASSTATGPPSRGSACAGTRPPWTRRTRTVAAC